MSLGRVSCLTCGGSCTKSLFSTFVSTGGGATTGGGVDSTTGGCVLMGGFFGHAIANRPNTTTTSVQANAFEVFFIARLLVEIRSYNRGSWLPRPRAREPAKPSLRLLRPIRILVLSAARQLLDTCAVDAHPVDLPLAAAVRLEGEPLAVRGPGRLLIRSFTGENPALACDQVCNANLETPVDARRVGNLFAVRRPRRIVVPISVERDAPHVRPLGIHHVDLRRAAAAGSEEDLASVRTPLRRRFDRGCGGEPPAIRAVVLDDVDVGIACDRADERDVVRHRRKRRGRVQREPGGDAGACAAAAADHIHFARAAGEGGVDHPLVVGRPARKDRQGAVMRDRALIAAVPVHQPDLPMAVAIGSERDLRKERTGLAVE